MFSKLITVLVMIGLFGLHPLANADDSCKAVFSDLYSWAARGKDGFDYWDRNKGCIDSCARQQLGQLFYGKSGCYSTLSQR